MAHGWDSYFHNLPLASSDPSTLRTSESEGGLSEHLENFSGHHEFSGSLTSHEAPTTNSNFNTNYYSNPSIGNTNSDCVYQTFFKESSWQADGEQLEKEYMPRCGNGDLEFGTDQLPTTETFPSSYAANLQGLKQDCGMLTASFLEDYSDISSCSDADVGETRPSCKFVAGNSVPKSKADVSITNTSSEWLFSKTGNVVFPAEYPCPNMSDMNANLTSPSDVKPEVRIDECAQEKMEILKSMVKSHTGNSESSVKSDALMASGGQAVEDKNDVDACKDVQPIENLKGHVTQGEYSNIFCGPDSSTAEEIEKYRDDNEEEIITTFDNDQQNLDKKILEKEMKESLDKENEKFDHPHSAHNEDGIMQDDKIDIPKRKESGLLKKEKQKSPNLKWTDDQDENMDSDHQEDETQSNPSKSLGLSVKMPDCKDATMELRKCASPVESGSQSSDKSNINPCLIPAVKTDDLFNDTSDKNESSDASPPELCFRAKGGNTDVNTCKEKDQTSTQEKTTITSCLDLDCNSPCVTSDSLTSDTTNENKQGIANDVEPCFQLSSSSQDRHPCFGKEIASPAEKKSPDPKCSDPPMTSDKKQPCVCNHLKSCLRSDTSCTDSNPCPENNTNINSLRDHQQSRCQSPMAPEQEKCGGVAENAREAFEELDTSTEESLEHRVVYGEPLSREDSSCDLDETKLDSHHNEDTSLARPDSNSINEEGQAPQLKLLQPVVIIRKIEPLSGMSNSYHCTGCQYTTHNVDHLIEHNYRCHSKYNIDYCQTCNLYLMRNDLSKKHLCCTIKQSPPLTSNSSPRKKRKANKCNKCRLVFLKFYQYVTHMRIHTGKTPYRCSGCGLYFSQSGSLQKHKLVPGRCKQTKFSVTNSDAVISEKETKLKQDLIKNKQSAKLKECYVKLVDIYKANICKLCGKCFSTADQAKKHVCDVHKEKNLSPSANQFTCKLGDEKSQKLENETREKCKCPLCPRLFKYSYNRARHLRNCIRNSISVGKDKTPGKYQCPLCHAVFNLASSRYRHINTFCLKDCVNRLAKERSKTRQKAEQKMHSNETELKTYSNETEQQMQVKENEPVQSKEIEQKKQETPALTNKPVPRYKCNHCPALFCYPSGKYRHMKKHELFKHTGKMIRYRNSAFSLMCKSTTTSSTRNEATTSSVTIEGTNNFKSADRNSSLTFSCHFCGKYFSTLQSLKKHESNHKGDKPYRCLDCGKAFKRRAYLFAHKIVHQRKIQCTVCRKTLPTVRDLIQHRSSHLKRGMLQCPDCHLKFRYPAHLLRHLKRHKNRENKATLMEEKPQITQFNLESVKGDQNGPMLTQCALCKEVFHDPHMLRKHCLSHISGSVSNQCPFCKQSFPNRRCLVRHMVKHTGDKPFSCSNCGKQFYRHVYLKLHSKQCVPTQTKHLVAGTKTRGPHQCSYCPRVFCKKMRLKNHLHAHKTNSLLLCTRCGQYFGLRKLNFHQKNCVEPEFQTGLSSSKTDLSKSTSEISQSIRKVATQSSATKMLRLKCPQCTRRFRYRSLLLRHLVSHTGLQPYACVHCGHRYRSKTMCLQHEALCDKEGEANVESDGAQRFNKSQRDEEEYKCKFCTKTFLKPRNLRRHILTHNEVKPYRCKACDSCFSRYDHLKVHQNRCKGRKARLEVCIPKISLDDVGRGWQTKFGIEASEKQETFECEICSRSFSTQSKLSRHNTMFHIAKLFKCYGCGSSFAHEKSLKKHRKMKRCKRIPEEGNASAALETNPPTKNVTKPLEMVKNRILKRIQPHFNKKLKYVCSYCPRAFRNTYQLGVHIRLHTGERPYPCEYCGQRFIRKDYLQRHFQKCTKKSQQNKVLCDRCGGFFPQDKLENHKETCTPTSSSAVCQQSVPASPTKGFSCAYCSSRFLLFSQLQEHFLNAHKMETLIPPVSTVPLQHHLSNMPKIKVESLDESCDKQLSGTGLMYKLDTVHEREDPNRFSCPVCNLCFASKAGLTGHVRVHTKEVPFNCKTCKKGFWNKSLLRNHYRKCRFGHKSETNSTQQLEVPVKAEIDFALNDSVLIFKEGSQTTGTGVLQTNFSCKDDSVDKSLQNSEGNEVQGNSSSVKKTVQYQCSECEQSFTDGLMLISHLEDHGREEQEKKRNTCPKCGRVCTSHGHLEKHMKIHGVFKSISCPNCSKTFYTLSDLEIHMACHELTRPFVCKLCNLRFWTRPSLCNHYSEDHPNDIFTCRFCNKIYSVKKSLARHYKKWHQKEQKEHESTLLDKRSAEKQSSSQVSTTGESDEDENNDTEDSDSDSAPYFPCHVCGKTFPTSESLEDHQRCHLGEKPHECAECGRCFFQASQLQQHQRMHKSEFQCQACGRGFVSLFALRKHKHTHGKSRPYRCSKCELSFTGPLQLAEHMSTHREENFPCDICSRVFRTKSGRAEHRKSHAKLTDHHPSLKLREEHKTSASSSESRLLLNRVLKYRCGVCNERFGDPEELSEHGCLAAKERPYLCLDCKKYFLHASHLKKHRTTHHQSRPGGDYPCNHCNSAFSSSSHFLSHLESHVNTTVGIKCQSEGKDWVPSHTFQCPVCHQYFATATELMGHFSMHREDSFECKFCKMTFSSRSKLKEHERNHLTSATRFQCTKCGRSFMGSEAFQQHHCSHKEQTNVENKASKLPAKTSLSTCQAPGEEEEIDVTGEDLFHCPVCTMQFSLKSALLEHQNKHHPNEKPFKCKFCGKTFALRRYCRVHEQRHHQNLVAQDKTQSSVKKLKCKHCNAEFSAAQDLSLHMRFHAEKDVGEFRCDMCYKSFSRWSLLIQHRESHVGQVVYECNECDKAFAFPHLLEEHQLSHAASSE